MKVVATASVLVAAGACGEENDGRAASSGRIEGQVVFAPACPVETAGGDCAPQPAAGAQVDISEVGSRESAQVFTTDEQGSFMAELPGGEYSLRAQTSPQIGAEVQTQVTVRSGETTSVQLEIDSGIR
jgi:hypothetical protein